MTSVNYNRGKPHKKFASIKSENTSIDNLSVDKLLSSITASNKTGSIILTNKDTVNIIDENTTGPSNIIIGNGAGAIDNGDNCIAIGTNAGRINQTKENIAIGSNAGYLNQKQNALAFGSLAGTYEQGINSIAIGYSAGKSNQGQFSTAFGVQAGEIDQGQAAMALGYFAGSNEQGQASIAIGNVAGQNQQGDFCIAIGGLAGQNLQGTKSIAIGSFAGDTDLGDNSIAIGYRANTAFNNSLVINTSNGAFSASGVGVYINGAFTQKNQGGDFRNLVYNPGTSQVVYDVASATEEIICRKSPTASPIGSTESSTTDIFTFYYGSTVTGMLYEIRGFNSGTPTSSIISRYIQTDMASETLTQIEGPTGDDNLNLTITNNIALFEITVTITAGINISSLLPFLTIKQFKNF